MTYDHLQLNTSVHASYKQQTEFWSKNDTK